MNKHDKEVIKNFTKWRKEQTKETREKRSAAVRRFLDYLKDGVEMEEAKKRICEAFDLTDRQLRNIVAGRALLTKDGATDMQAKIQRVIDRAETQIELITEHMNDVLEDIDQAERDGVEKYEIEYEDSESSKMGTGWKTKSLPLNEARSLIRKRFMAELKQFTSMIHDLVPDHVINTTIYNSIDQKEVENEVMALIKRNRLSDDTFKESK